ncbi:MAG: hypothetical protein K2X27_10580 [Candidatus Obscuribacterales bacterium]|nr:hypothetical protein [Candidatus Obscuribacterales bacterium]
MRKICWRDFANVGSFLNRLELCPESACSKDAAVAYGRESNSESSVASRSSVSPKLWIVNPVVDMLFVCGGMLWLLVNFAAFNPVLFAGKTAPLFMILTQLGAIFFLDAHNAATILRICNEKELRDKHKVLWLWAPLLLFCLFGLSLWQQTVFLLCLKIYISLVPQHLTAQSYGICLMYFARANAAPTPKETVALKVAFSLMALTSIIRNFSSKAVSELMGVAVPSLVLVPDSLGWYLAGLAWVFSLFAFMMILKRILHEGRSVPFGAIMLALSTLILLTLGPSIGFAVVFSSAFLHASQYLIVSAFVHLKKTECSEFRSSLFSHPIFKSAIYWGQATVIGVLLYLVLPTFLGHFGIPIAKAAVAVLCFASLHHFLADSIIWRMKDPKTRAVLTAGE